MCGTYPVQEPWLQAREGCRPPSGRRIRVGGQQAVPGVWHEWAVWPRGEECGLWSQAEPGLNSSALGKSLNLHHQLSLL